MIALKLILQSLAGIVALGGAIGGTVALTNKKATTQTEIKQEERKQIEEETLIKHFSEDYEINGQRIYGRPQKKIIEVVINESDQATNVFYLVSAAIDIADKKPSTDLFANENLEVKNYQCINKYKTTERDETITKDTSCILYSLKEKKNSALKTSEIKAFIKNTNQISDWATKTTKQSEIIKNKFFLLEANQNLNKSLIINPQMFIDLTIKNAKTFYDPSDLYVKLQVHAKIANNELTGATDTIIAKAASNPQNSNISSTALSPSYQCSFKSEEQKTDCMLSKISQYTTPTNSFNFESETIKNKSEATNIETGSYYLIKTDEIIPHEIKNLKGSKTKYIETNSQNSITTTLSIESAVFAKFKHNGSRLSELIILD